MWLGGVLSSSYSFSRDSELELGIDFNVASPGLTPPDTHIDHEPDSPLLSVVSTPSAG